MIEGPFRVAAGLLACSVALWAGRAGPPRPHDSQQTVRRAHYVMGTIFEITARGAGREATAAAIEDAFGAIRRADELLSHYKNGNELARMNAAAARGAVEVDPDLYALLARSVRYASLSGGAFDITVSPLVRLWARAGEQNRLPPQREMAETLEKVGYGAIELLPSSRVRYRRDGLEVQFGAIGKGWAVDQALARLKRNGIRDALVSAGGSTVSAIGSSGRGGGWRVGIRDPRAGAEREAATLCIDNMAISTSGSYELFTEIAGRRYGHIIDPRGGKPVEPMLSATVISSDAAEADALSTAVYVLGPRDGERLLRRLGLGGVLITRPERGGGLAIRRIEAPAKCAVSVGVRHVE